MFRSSVEGGVATDDGRRQRDSTVMNQPLTSRDDLTDVVLQNQWSMTVLQCLKHAHLKPYDNVKIQSTLLTCIDLCMKVQ